MNESKKKDVGASDDVAKAAPFVVARVDDKYVRLALGASAPEGVPTFTSETVAGMTIVEISEIYSKIVGTSPKKFKDKRVALESLAYQVAKMPIFDPSAPKPEPAARAVGGKRERASKSPDTFELLQPANLDEVVRGLAPQARALVSIMADLAKELGSASFGGAALEARLKVPEVAALLRTKQDPMRILTYYKGKLVSVGMIRVS